MASFCDQNCGVQSMNGQTHVVDREQCRIISVKYLIRIGPKCTEKVPKNFVPFQTNQIKFGPTLDIPASS